MPSKARPLSPHLGIYRWSMTMALSIVHRMSGGFLGLGAIVMVMVLVSIASGPESFSGMQALLGSFLGQLFLFAWTLALYIHLANGVRHLVWDAGYGFGKEESEKTALIAIAAGLALTILTWIVAWVV